MFIVFHLVNVFTYKARKKKRKMIFKKKSH